MGEFYQYCSICDGELNDVEKKMNEEQGSIYYPICAECLSKSAERLIHLVEEPME